MDVTAKLQDLLSRSSGLSVDLMINENRSHLFSILEKRRSYARLSLHRMFLEAPEPVIVALGSYIKRRDRSALQVVSQFIDERAHKPQYTQDPGTLETEGDYVDLKEIFARVKERYFASIELERITWFRQKRTRSRMIFGQYHPLLQLIKINKRLDHPSVPLYFLEFVVFHEMLHHVIPVSMKESGRRAIHSAEFCRLERGFVQFKEAREWQNKHRHLFFEGVF